ncbi:hypothetical protein M8818_005216 [Zalaria obscura]|uniref:Uncharacterized protein n=1 Tax=Zalaria obscura TaxID=2024903 RepID=A0ACC3SBA6_9PEZI
MSGFYLPEGTPTTTAETSPLHSPTSPSPHPRFDYDPSNPSPFYQNSSDDEDTLPYPAPLPRSDFLSPNFSPQDYLSTLHNRHQTLEDLRSDLRVRSQELSKELLDLVNGNYEEFLSLGSTLRGGDDKVEEVRVGVLGFRREVEGVRDRVAEREREVRLLVEERKGLRKGVATGRKLLDIDERLTELEGRLMGAQTGEEDSENDEEGEDEGLEELTDGERVAQVAVLRLRKHAVMYLRIGQLMDQVGRDHPFIVSQQARMMKVRNTLLLDLATMLKQAKTAGQAGSNQMLKIVGVYRDMDESSEAVKVLKGG